VANDQLAAFIDRHMASWNRHDATALCNDHAEDGVVVSPMFARMEGRAQICTSYTALFAVFPDWHIRFDAPIRDGSRIAVPFSVTATHKGDFMGLPGTGRRCEFEGVSLYELDDALLIREERRVYDFTGLLTRLGVLKVKPAV
jgi:steroid delta-isomerase-like uncharacterized protein